MKPSSFATDDSELTLDWLARCVGTRRASDPAHLDALVGVLMLDTGFKRFPRDRTLYLNTCLSDLLMQVMY